MVDKLKTGRFRGRKSERGQSFMELAISLVFLLMLVSVVIDLGWAFYTMTALRDTVQEAASYGIMCPDPDYIEDRLVRSATQPVSQADLEASIASGDTIVESIAVYPAAAWEKGSIVKITVTIDHTIKVPFLTTVVGTTYPLSVNVSDTIMVDDCPSP